MAENVKNIFLMIQNEFHHQNENESDSDDEAHAGSLDEEYIFLDETDSEEKLVEKDFVSKIEEKLDADEKS